MQVNQWQTHNHLNPPGQDSFEHPCDPDGSFVLHGHEVLDVSLIPGPLVMGITHDWNRKHLSHEVEPKVPPEGPGL